MFAVKAAFSLLETAREISEDRASRVSLENYFSELPEQSPWAFAQQKLTDARNWGADQPHNHLLSHYAGAIKEFEDTGLRIIDIEAPQELQLELIETLRQTFPGANTDIDIRPFQAAGVLTSWQAGDGKRRDRVKLILSMSEVALGFVGAYSHRLGLRGQAENIVGAITDGLSSHIARNRLQITETAFTAGAGKRIAEALLSTSLEIAETRPELFSDKQSVQALVQAAVSPLRELNAENAGLDLNATQRLIKIRDTLRGPVGIGVIQTLHTHRREIFDEDYPEKESAAGIVTDALFESLVSQVSDGGGLGAIITPAFFARAYPSVLGAVAASPQAFVRGTGQHVEFGQEFLTGLMESLTVGRKNPKLAQSIFEMGMEMTRRHARVYLVSEARAALSAEMSERVAASDKPWALVQIKILNHIAEQMISRFEANGIDMSILAVPAEQGFILDLVGLVADQVAQTPGMILGDDVNPEVLSIARGVATFIASEHASLVSRADWQRVSAHAVALAMENPETLFSLDASDPEDFLAVTLIKQVLSSAQASLSAQADGTAPLARQSGQILFGRTLAQALMSTLDLAASHARQLATETGQQALSDFIDQLNTLAAGGGTQTLSSQDWIYAFRWFLSDVVSTGQFDVSEDMILNVVASMHKGQAAQPFAAFDQSDADLVANGASPGSSEIYYQPVPPQGAEG